MTDAVNGIGFGAALFAVAFVQSRWFEYVGTSLGVRTACLLSVRSPLSPRHGHLHHLLLRKGVEVAANIACYSECRGGARGRGALSLAIHCYQRDVSGKACSYHP